ncbi:MAG: methylmalonyl-CoA mutase, partial [Actinobacteria bacterium]|nr:methylmalonyl-CoA mutase [Actinomycetota bacterium]
LTDELIHRLRVDQADKLRTAVLAIDPSRRRGGGALLGDRIRMNSLGRDMLGSQAPLGDRVYFRSLATRGSSAEVPTYLADMISATKAAGYDLVVVETPGIGQADSAVTDLVDLSLYVMTAEFGAASQLEKIEMLDFADVVAINKFERRGSEDARRDVARQLVRNRNAFGQTWEDMPVFGTSAASFNDDGVTALYQYLRDQLATQGLPVQEGTLAHVSTTVSTHAWAPLPANRVRYLSEISDAVRDYHVATGRQVELARRRALHDRAATALDGRSREALEALAAVRDEAEAAMDPATLDALRSWPAVVESYSGDEQVVVVRDRELHTPLRRETLSGNTIPRVALPRYSDDGELVRFLRTENLPGYFPFTAGVFPFKRDGEDPARMFAGEGD